MSAKTKISPAPDYVAVGRNIGGSVPYSLSYSSDGITWSSSTLPAGSNGLGSAVFGEDKFVAITAVTTNEAAYSTDGITWTATTLPSAGNWSSLSYGGGKFIAIRYGSNVAAYSIDGITWTATTMPASANWLSATYGDGKFVAIALESSANAYSTDGITWTAGTMPTAYRWQNVAYGGGKFVAIVNDSTNFAYSSNGSTWTLGSMPYSYEDWSKVAYGDGKFVALINGSSKSAYSLDGVSWTASSMPSSQYWSAITYGDGKFVALSYQSTTTAYSTDGITWSTSTITAAAGWGSIAYAPARWREMVAPYIKVSGVWKMAKSAYIKVSGSWKNWFLQGGTVDQSFSAGLGFNSNTSPVAFAANGKFFVGGSFTSFNGVTTNRLVKLNSDGTRDTSFSVGTGAFNGFDADPSGIIVQPDQKVIVVGSFTAYGNPSYQSANRIIRLNSDGTRDTSFNVGTGIAFGAVRSAALQADGKIVVIGTSSGIIRLNSDGTTDTSFNVGTGFNGSTYDGLLQADGKIVVSGDFTSYNGTAANRIIRLNSDGTRDTSFVIGTGFNDTVFIALQTDGKIVASGWFTSYNGASANYIIRLNSDGTRDTSFVIGTGFNSFVNRRPFLQSNGKIIVPIDDGGATSYKGVTIGRLIRLDSSGNLEVNFQTNLGTITGVNRVFQHPDGNLIVTGAFTSVGAISASRIVKISSEITG